jgi:hypothetical protein
MINDMVDHPTNSQMERIDKMITLVLQKLVKCIQGMRRNIPFSKQKVIV